MFHFIYMILKSYVQNEKVISKLSETYPIRRAAQIVVLVFNKYKGIASDKKIGESIKKVNLEEMLRNLEEKAKKNK